MKKYFAISDIHGFYTAMKKSLDKAGYNKDNKNHVLIVVGDCWDRGEENVKVYEFLKSIPKERRILIRGNHEFLLKDAVERGIFLDHDYHNRTVNTVCEFANYYDKELSTDILDTAFDVFKKTKILDWIFSDEWVNYYEIDDKIFVHAWLPLNKYTHTKRFEDQEYSKMSIKKNWRKCSIEEWKNANWNCPWMCYAHGLYPKDKTIVCGHWHAFDFRLNLGEEKNIKTKKQAHTTYIRDNLVALDACTVLSGFCNVYAFKVDN